MGADFHLETLCTTLKRCCRSFCPSISDPDTQQFIFLRNCAIFQEVFLFLPFLRKEGFLTSEDASMAQHRFASGEANLITSLRCHTSCRCAEVYYRCERQLAHATATCTGEGGWIKCCWQPIKELRCRRLTGSYLLTLFCPPSRYPSPLFDHSWISCSKESFCFVVVDSGRLCMVPVLWQHMWVRLSGEKIGMKLTDCQCDLKGRGWRPWGFLLPPLTLPDTPPLIKSRHWQTGTAIRARMNPQIITLTLHWIKQPPMIQQSYGQATLSGTLK